MSFFNLLTISIKAALIDMVDHFILVQIILWEEEVEGKQAHTEGSSKWFMSGVIILCLSADKLPAGKNEIVEMKEYQNVSG